MTKKVILGMCCSDFFCQSADKKKPAIKPAIGDKLRGLISGVFIESGKRDFVRFRQADIR